MLRTHNPTKHSIHRHEIRNVPANNNNSSDGSFTVPTVTKNVRNQSKPFTIELEINQHGGGFAGSPSLPDETRFVER